MKRLALLGVLAFVAVWGVACGDDENYSSSVMLDSSSSVIPDLVEDLHSSSSSENGESAPEQVRGDNEAGMTSSAAISSATVAESFSAETSSSSSLPLLSSDSREKQR